MGQEKELVKEGECKLLFTVALKTFVVKERIRSWSNARLLVFTGNRT